MELRKEIRYPLTCGVEAVPSTGRDQESGKPRTFRGTVVNISAGGACVLGEQPVEPFSVFLSRFHFPGVPVPVPVLTQVRWVEPVPSGKSAFRVGLFFIA